MSPSPPAADPVRLFSLTDDEVGFYCTEGYIILPGLLDPQQVGPLHDETLELIDHDRPPHAKLQQTSRVFASGLLEKLATSENLRVLASRLMEGESSLHNPFTAVKAGGGGRFHFHQDNQYTTFEGPGINFWFALVDVAPENGALQIVPRSHLEGTTFEGVPSGDGDEYLKIDWEPEYFLPLRLRAGDAVAFNRLTIHGSCANTTDRPRVAYGVQFFRNDVRALVDGEMRLLSERPKFPLKRIER